MSVVERIFARIGGRFRSLRRQVHAGCATLCARCARFHAARARSRDNPAAPWVRDWPPASADWTTPVPLANTLKDSMQIYETFRNYVQHEDNLINHRMTWVFTIHGFLYATYGFSLQKKVEIDNGITGKLVEKFAEIDGYGNALILANERHVTEYLAIGRVGLSVLEVDLFLVAITLLGICLSWYGQKSIRAAGNAAESVRDQFHRQFRRSMIEEVRNGTRVTMFCIQVHPLVCLPSITGGGTSRVSTRGFTVARKMPIAMMVGWFGALIYLAIEFWLNWPLYSHVLKTLLR